jgi:hypothetical protein
MSYDAIDPQITAWADRHGVTLFREWDGAQARFCYTSSDAGECFQLVVREPQSGRVKIEAFSIETANDDEFQQSWDVPVSNVDEGLETALTTVEDWKRGVGRPAASGSATRSA